HFRYVIEKADALLWVFKYDPLHLVTAKRRWASRPAVSCREYLVLFGQGNPAEIEDMFAIPCLHVKGADDRNGLRRLFDLLDATPAVRGPRILAVGFESAPELPGPCYCFTEAGEAQCWLEQNEPDAIILAGDLPKLVFVIGDIREKYPHVPIGVAGGGPEVLKAGADDVFFELSYEAVELLLTRAERTRHLKKEAEVDALTGVLSRKAGERELERMAVKNAGNLAVAVIDLDHFKQVNDTYGHQAGDEVLRTFGDYLRKNVRSSDLVFRYGGEEFVLVMQGTPLDGAVRACENLLERWKETDVILPDGRTIRISFSAGVAECNGAVKTAIAKADEALYKAKNEGRAKVCY
ncbi:MAG: GGDEF domain-containing protein, partial [Desulfitobacteriaceae bacterium]|nr:GGDEF domain-containing protein [Desulfitobacteriaceae bacterium]